MILLDAARATKLFLPPHKERIPHRLHLHASLLLFGGYRQLLLLFSLKTTGRCPQELTKTVPSNSFRISETDYVRLVHLATSSLDNIAPREWLPSWNIGNWYMGHTAGMAKMRSDMEPVRFPRVWPSSRRSTEDRPESDSSTSPERAVDDDTDFFMVQANDSQSSLGVGTLREPNHERQASISPILRLPPELLISVFTKLSSPADMLSCMLVSQNWAANCVAILWHRPLCNNWDNLLKVVSSVRKPDSFFPYYDLVKRLNLSTLSEKISDGTVLPFVQCNRIERLTLTNCSKLTDKGVSDLVSGNRHLQALDVTEMRSLTDHTLFTVSEHCPRLQGLNITGCKMITDDSLIAVSERCRQIKRVRFSSPCNAWKLLTVL